MDFLIHRTFKFGRGGSEKGLFELETGTKSVHPNIGVWVQEDFVTHG